MWAASLETPCHFDFIELEPPSFTRLAPGDVMLRTLVGGICGSDTPKFRGVKGGGVDSRGRFRPGPPGFPLHEIVGEVVAARDSDLVDGQRVVGWVRASDGLSELVVTSDSDVTPYSPALDPVTAVLIQPLACVLEAMDRLSVRDRRVAVLGLGPIGLLFAHVAQASGARQVVGVDPMDRSGHPAHRWMDHAVVSSSASWAQAVKASERPEVVIEAVGHQTSTLDDAITACAPGGTMLYFGIPDQDVYPINMERLMRKNLVLIGGVTRERRDALRRADAYLVAHPELESLITHRFERKDATAAFGTAAQPSPERLKVVLTLDV